jgi:hypothetical protein
MLGPEMCRQGRSGSDSEIFCLRLGQQLIDPSEKDLLETVFSIDLREFAIGILVAALSWLKDSSIGWCVC